MNNFLKKPRRNFERDEFESRLNRAHKYMSINKLDAILITTPSNFRYFTGFDSYFWESPTRPWFLIIPNGKTPKAIIPSIGEIALKKTCIKEIYSWASPNPKDEGVSLLAKFLNEVKNIHGNIGIEGGKESTMRMPFLDFMNLKEKVEKFTFVDASESLWNLRMIKSKKEIDHLKFICKITSDAYEKLPETISIGETERDICNKLKIDLIKRGADHTLFMACSSGKNGYEQIIFEPTDNNLINGSILFIDTGSTYNGYFCDFDRNFAFGNVDDKVNKAYQATWEALSKGIEVAKPGNKCSMIFKEMNKVLEDAGSRSSGIGRMGHGFGLQLTEPPSNMINDDTELKPGMAIAIEPVFEFESGKMIVQEENIIITSDGNEVITTRSPKEIPIIK